MFLFFKKKEKSPSQKALEQREQASKTAFERASEAKKKKFDFSSMPRNKKIIFIASGILGFLVMVGIISSLGGDSKKELAKQVQQNQQQAQSTQTQQQEENKYPIDVSKLEALKNPPSSEPVKNNNPASNELSQKPPVQSIQPTFQEREKKPENMVDWLNKNKNVIQFQRKHLAFVYENQRYTMGIGFKDWWRVEEITPNYIRFYDPVEDYAYNLRYVD